MENRTTQQKSLDGRPPSFSWLSVEAPVLVPRSEEGRGSIVSVLAVDVGNCDVLSTGPAQSAELLLKGYLRRIELVSDYGEERDPLLSSVGWRLIWDEQDIQCFIRPDFSRSDLPVDSKGRQTFFLPFLYAAKNRVPETNDADAVLRRDAQRAGHLHSPRPMSPMTGILLEALPGNDGAFRRIGLCTVHKPKAAAAIFEPQAEEQNFPCVRYDKQEGQHTVRIL